MIPLNKRSKSSFGLAIAMLSLGLVGSCKTPSAPDARQELVNSLKGANVDGYLFATREDEAQVIVSLTNSAVRNLIRLESDSGNVVLRYTSIKEKTNNTTRIHKTEAVKTGTVLALVVTDVATGDVISRKAFPVAEPHHTDTGAAPTFDTLEDCIKDFDCKRRGAIQCEANRTCEDQFAALTCCLKNGQCFSVHLIIRPTSLRCRLIGFIPDLEGLVLSQ